MFDLSISIYLASKTRWVHLVKTVGLPAVPRVGEHLKLRNDEMGDYFAWQVAEVTYRESGEIEIMTDLLDDVGGRGYSFDSEVEFDEYLESYEACGWGSPHGIKPNTRYKGSVGTPPQGA